MKTLSFCIVKYTPKVPLILLTVEKIEHEKYNLVLLLLLRLLFSSHITQKVYGVYEGTADQMIALLSDIIFFLVRVALS